MRSLLVIGCLLAACQNPAAPAPEKGMARAALFNQIGAPDSTLFNETMDGAAIEWLRYGDDLVVLYNDTIANVISDNFKLPNE